MIVLTPFSYTFSKGRYITVYQGEMVATIKFFKGNPPKRALRGREYVSQENKAIVDPWISSQPREVIEEGLEKLRAYLDAGGNPKDSFKK